MVSKLETEKDNILKMLAEGKNYEELSKFYGYCSTRNFKRAAINCGIIPDSNGVYHNIEKKEYECKYCGKKFDSSQKLGGHITFCKQNPNIDNNLKKLEENRDKLSCNLEKNYVCCQYCGREVLGNGCLVLHEKSCKKNPNRVPRKVSSKGKSHPAWNKGKTMADDERIAKYSATRRKAYENGTYIPHSTPHTEETKEILREKMIEFIKRTGNGEFGQHFSSKGCEYIDKLNEEKGWHLQHALNGGEIEVGGYFLDGYDEKNNIVFEYDEPKHYKDVYNNILKDKDIERQNYIIQKLHCDFYRYNEKMNCLYKVN